MKIATWNVERLAHRRELNEIISLIEEMNADILVLTEYDEGLRLSYKECVCTPTPPDTLLSDKAGCVHYAPTEHRAAIFTNYKIVRKYDVFDENTAVCAEVETEEGNLIVYGTVMGVFGNRHFSFMSDVEKQCADFARLAAENKNLCICGDFNLSFADGYYYTKQGRNAVLDSIKANGLSLLTKELPECIDHIAVSESLVGERQISIEEYNIEKRLSDHRGIAVRLL